MRRVVAVLVLAGALIPVQSAAASGNPLLASGTVTETTGWTTSFDIHAKGSRQSSLVSITQGIGGPTSTFSGSVCNGTYTDPTLGGPDVYSVGPVVSGNEIYGTLYEAFIVHKGGPLGADYAWSVPANLPTRASAQAFCRTVSTITPAFAVDAATDLVFNV
jgi:hypothetical protein